MVKINSLKNLDGDERKVREVCTAGDVSIVIYEPSKYDIQTILEMQDDIYDVDAEGNLSIKIDGITMIRKIYPILTDLEGFDELSDRELMEVLDNPSIALVQASSVIEQVIIEVYKITVLSMRKNMIEEDLKFENDKFAQQLTMKIMESTTSNGNFAELGAKINEVNEQMDKLDDLRRENESARIFDETQRFQKMKEDNIPAAEVKESKSSIPMNIEPGTEQESMESVMARYNESFGINLKDD